VHYDQGSRLDIRKFVQLPKMISSCYVVTTGRIGSRLNPFPAIVEDWPNAQGIPGHPQSKGDVIIGNDVWIGTGATILSVITIGH